MRSKKVKTKTVPLKKAADFRFFKNASLQGFVSLQLSEKALTNLGNLDVLLENTELNKNSKSTTAGIVELDGKQYFLKRYNNKNFPKQLKNSVRETRPFKVLKTSRILREVDVFTPEVYAALNYRRGLLLKSSYLLSRFVQISKTLTEIIQDLTDEKELAIFIEKSCCLLIKMHEAGIMHGDPKISNILIMPEADNSYNLGVIDLDGSACFLSALSKEKRIHDLARLISSYYRSCKDRDLTVKNLDALMKIFAKKYHELSNVNLASKSLNKRVKYLSMRVRKK